MSARGLTVLMACACGAGSSSAKLLQMWGVGATAQITHAALLAIGIVLIVRALARLRPHAAVLATAAFVVLAIAATLTPPTVMSRTHIPWNAPQLAGGVLYLLFASLLALSFWRGLALPRTGVIATAMGGTALATGCSCCMVTGAVAGLIASAGGGEIFMTQPIIFFTGVIILAFSLARIGSWRPLPWIAAGAMMTTFGGDVLKYTGDWYIGDVNLRFIPGYVVYIIGAGLVMKAWAVALAKASAAYDEPARDDAVALLT